MIKIRFILLCFLIPILIATIVIAASPKQEIRECRKELSYQRRIEYKECINDYKDCRKTCNQEKKACLSEVKQNYSECKDSCSDRKCKRTCSQEMRTEKKECSKTQCLKNCRNESRVCKQEAKNKYKQGKADCEFGSFNVKQEDCEAAGGFYHEICNGPYFDIICSPKKFCICDGNSGYSCPGNYTCNHDIKGFLPRKIHTIQGYKDLLGNKLGDIGICEKQQ